MAKKVSGSGPMNAKIVVVGEAPGQEEEREGEPFVGKSGELLRKELINAGIPPERVRFENICKYRPKNNKIETFYDRDGNPGWQIQEGLGELEQTLDIIQPNVVLAVGNYPMRHLTGKGYWRDGSWTGIQDQRGGIVPSIMHEGKVVLTFHPAYILRRGRADSGAFAVDILRAGEEMKHPYLHWPSPKLYLETDLTPEFFTAQCDEVIYPVKKMDRAWLKEKLLNEGDIITFDIEYISGKLLCIGMTNSKDWAVTFKGESLEDIQFYKDILLSGKPLAAQNSMFDLSILEWHYDIPVMRYVKYDTMLAAHAANPELPKGLDYLESIYTRWPNHKGMVDWKKVKKGEQSIDTVMHYNAIDVVAQHEIRDEQLIWDLDDPMVRQVFEFEMELNSILWEVSKRGIRVDHERLEQFKIDTEERLAEIKLKLELMNGGPINVKSYPQVGEFLFNTMGISSPARNPGGSYKTDDKTLAGRVAMCKNDEQREAINLIRMARKQRDLLSKFIEVELDEDGRSRGSYYPGGTTTGRLSSKKFAPTGMGHQQQNIPRDKEIRSVFIPDDGMGYGYFDLMRAESLVVAHITNDPLMLEHHEPGTDAHTALASIIFNKPEEEITPEERYLGKQTRHAGNYMEGARVMKININKYAHETGVWVEEADCKEFLQTYQEVHTQLRPWWRDTQDELWRTHKLSNLLGWERIFFGHVNSILPEAVAFNPQSTVGHTLNVGVCLLHGRILDYFRDRLTMPEHEIIQLSETIRHDWGFQMLQQVHDAVGFQYNLDYEEEIIWGVSKLMEVRLRNPKTYEDFIIPVEPEVGPSWGEVKKVPIKEIAWHARPGS